MSSRGPLSSQSHCVDRGDLLRRERAGEAGFDVKLPPNATLGLCYSGQFCDGVIDQGAKVDFGVRF